MRRMYGCAVAMTAATLASSVAIGAGGGATAGGGLALAAVNEFISAQAAFDRAKLDALTTPDFVEVSPVGEIDDRAAFLGFYDPSRRSAALVQIRASEPLLREGRDCATVVMRLAYTINGAARPGGVRAGYTLRRVKGVWRLSTAQYTPLRTPAS